MTQLPTGWLYESINSIVVGGMIADGDWVESKDQDSNGQVRLTQLADVGDGEFRSRSDRWMNDEQASRLNVNYLRPGDLLMARMPDPLGRTCMVPENIGRAVTVVDVAIIRFTRKDVNPKFVMWLLNSPGIRQQIEMLASGTTRRRITRKNLGTIDLPMPPIDEQNKIVELLEDNLSRLDAALADVKQAKVKAAQFRRSLFQAAFTGNLGSGETSFLTELPEGWDTKRLDDIADIVMGQSPPGSSYNEHGEGQPFFQGKTEFGEVHPTVRKYTTAGTKFAKAGDILMSVRAPVGPTNIADIDCVIGRGLAAIRAKTIVSQDYLRWALKHLELDIQSKGTGTTFGAITGEKLRGTLVALPPIDEQNKIVELLEDHLSRLDTSVSLADALEKQSNGLRRSLLQAAFTGQLTKEVANV